MSAREQALVRDLAARARLADDPIYQIKQAREPGHAPRPRIAPATSDVATGREIDVLRYMSRGLTRQMTAEAMGLSEQTVMTYLARVRARLRAKNTTQACCEAIRRGLIP